MPDAIFEDPRLARVYDPLDPDRDDLDVYAAVTGEFDARSVERAAAIDTCIYTLSTSEEFTYFTCSAKASKQTCRLTKNES